MLAQGDAVAEANRKDFLEPDDPIENADESTALKLSAAVGLALHYRIVLKTTQRSVGSFHALRVRQTSLPIRRLRNQPMMIALPIKIDRNILDLPQKVPTKLKPNWHANPISMG